MSATSEPPSRSFARRLALPLVVMACCRLAAQAPERPQEVEVPGLGIMLRAGWQLLFHDRCRFAVPVSWHADPDEAFARAPDGSNISIQMHKMTSWSAYKADIRRMYANATLYDDSSRRLWFAFPDGSRLQHYVAVVEATSVCVGWLELHAGASTAPDLVKRIADGIGPAPETWPAEDK
jgi:hypothetical protein